MKKVHPWSRREFLISSGLAAAAASLPLGSLRAQAPYTRYEMTSPDGLRMLEGYKTAVGRLLAKVPEDPLNWYRLTLIHTLDCPHGNWWFLPWHRGYTGYVEQILRAHSDMPDFALPYWDWTANPEVSPSFFGSDNALDPTSSNQGYIPTLAEFQSRFEGPIAMLYGSMMAAQLEQLTFRNMETEAKLWDAINGGLFFPSSEARCLSSANPTFATPPGGCSCAGTPKAVSIETLNSALSPDDFITFGSGIATQHSENGTFQGVLEDQPHNLVHNCTGGFMGDFMSPVDPLFFMHHSNIERLWTVWTAKQEAAEPPLPTLPEGQELIDWSAEPFLFYVNASGQTLSTTAGDFSTVAGTPFDYVYTPGSPLTQADRRKAKSRSFNDLSDVPFGMLRATAKEDGPELLARVTIDPQGRQKGKSFHVLLNPPEGTDPKDSSSPHHVATLAFFGGGNKHGHKTTFLVPISGALRRLKAADRLKSIRKAPQLFVAVEDHQENTVGKAQKVKAVISNH